METSDNQALEHLKAKALTTITIVMSAIVFFIFFGIFQIVTGASLSAWSSVVFGVIGLTAVVFARQAATRYEFNRAGWITVITVPAFAFSTVILDPGNTWIIGMAVAIAGAYIAGSLLDVRGSVFGMYVGIAGGTIVALSDCARLQIFSISLNDVFYILLTVILIFLVLIIRLYPHLYFGSKFLLIVTGITLFVVVVMNVSVLAVIDNLTKNTDVPLLGGNGNSDELARSMIFISGIVILISSALSFAANRAVVRPLAKIVEIADAIAERGDLSMTAVVDTHDEFNTLANSFNRMVAGFRQLASAMEKVAGHDLTVGYQPRSEQDGLGLAFVQMKKDLGQVLSEVLESVDSLDQTIGGVSKAISNSRQATSQIAQTMQSISGGITHQNDVVARTINSSGQVGRAIESVAQGAHEQSKAVIKTSDLTNQINAGIMQVANASQTVTTESNRATSAARDGALKVNAASKGMNSIRAKVGLSAEKVKEMGARSEQIGVIVDAIDDIAGQTNLLALNAAIEAARAGEQGKGFAVVADEVRKLAERASASTKEIAGLVQSIQKTVAEAVKAMNDGASEVETGVVLANQAGEALDAILNAAESVAREAEKASKASDRMITASTQLVSSMDSVSAVVEENTAATEEMSAASSEVSESIESIAAISEENSAAIEEVTASAQEITIQVNDVSMAADTVVEQSSRLRDIVNKFKLKKEAPVEKPLAQPSKGQRRVGAGMHTEVIPALRSRK